MSASRIFLDNNATTVILPEVAKAMSEAWTTAFANPGSQHSFGRDARRVLEDSRDAIAQILGADPTEVIFTSGGTESINAAINGLTLGRKGVIALTAGEHPATAAACERARQNGLKLLNLTVDSSGLLQPEQFANLPWAELKLVCVILAHNETGVIQDLTQLSDLCEQHRVPLLIDAVQAVGKIPVNFHKLKATALAFGAHKFHGPRGIGGLLLRRGVQLPPLLEGGHQESGRRAGTEPVPLIAGMATALRCFDADCEARMQRVQKLRDQLQQALCESSAPTVVHGSDAPRLPNTLSIAFPGVDGEAMLVSLDLEGIACSLGSTCASGSAEPAPALLAMNIEPAICTSSVRFSVSDLNTEAEIADAAARIANVVSRLREQR
ncbi:cysteine desulfurase family protein [Fuerstiella marisgermanici]|uniref:Cysteine desulfurase n=1 Tax=Fuerstiella marisgermanici TaxID=1891926 RepID=A0A1P8WKJ1_9PLAN|nr:cysteine desulfurase family protein [Fuerstiella marisgermanici]APZ94576.1 Cysteine desulfurase [Fuerstiella marisgermanici]